MPYKTEHLLHAGDRRGRKHVRGHYCGGTKHRQRFEDRPAFLVIRPGFALVAVNLCVLGVTMGYSHPADPSKLMFE